MFTGLVEEIGEVVEVERLGTAARLGVRAPAVTAGTAVGDSIAVAGACVTVTGLSGSAGDTFAVDVMAETLRRTTLGGLRPGDRVNLERAATLSSRLGGHVVQGHVDGVGRLLHRVEEPRWHLVRISLPAGLGRYLVNQGSITIDGTSLTVVQVTEDEFSVSLIPATLAATTLGDRRVGDPVNLEVDVLAKYVERLLPVSASAGRPRDPRG